MNLKNIFTLAFTLLVLVSSSAIAQRKDWDKLGTRAVDYKLDRDVIHVGADNGRYTKLKVAVTGGALNMHKMTVHYMNGTSQNISVKHNFSRNSATRLIDLVGNKRFIKKIVFHYDTKNLARSKAKVHVFGRS
ncbi:MAG: DUF2541 family protein [bacterium]|nr:DUF2541 family protein [bacterium]